MALRAGAGAAEEDSGPSASRNDPAIKTARVPVHVKARRMVILLPVLFMFAEKILLCNEARRILRYSFILTSSTSGKAAIQRTR